MCKHMRCGSGRQPVAVVRSPSCWFWVKATRAKHLRILSIVGIGLCASSNSGTTRGTAVTSSIAKALPPVPPSAGGSMDHAMLQPDAGHLRDTSILYFRWQLGKV